MTFDRCRTHSVTFGYYKFIYLFIHYHYYLLLPRRLVIIGKIFTFLFPKGVSATQSGLRTISATCRLDNAPAGSRPAVVSVTFALHVTGDSQCADHVAVITTLRPVIPRQESVSTVSTTLMARTVKFAPLVTMVTPQVVSD